MAGGGSTISPRNPAFRIVLLFFLYALTLHEAVGQASLPARNGLIAFADAPASEPGPQAVSRAHIFTIDADGRNRRQVTKGAGGYLLPAWSPDGELLAFASPRRGLPEIGVIKSDGTGERIITRGLLPAWSPDGKWLAFFREEGSRRQIWVVGVDGKNEKQLTTQGGNAVPAWSPDGEWIAYWSGDERGYGQIWAMRRDGSGKRQLTFPTVDAYTPKGSSANAPAWLYSRKIAYWAGVEHAYGQIWTMNPDGSNAKRLTRARAPASSDNPAWSPDGTKILFDTQRRGVPEIWVMDADGANERVLVSDVKVIPARTSWQPLRQAR